MNFRRKLCTAAFLFFASALFGAEEFSDLLRDWFAVETGLTRWQNSDNTGAEELLSSLKQFRASLEDITESLLFSQYEWTGLLPEGSGKDVCRMADALAAGVVFMEAAGTTASARTAMIRESAAIRQELYSWSRLESRVSSRMYSHFLYMLGVYLFIIIVFTFVVWFLYRALRRSRAQEQDSAEFSRITMLAQEKERTLISAELHDTVLQDMGRLLRLSEDYSRPLMELSRQIMTRTKEICRTLMPPDFSRLALTDSLRQLCADFEKRASVECRAVIAADFSAGRLSPPMQLQVYRIVQEALVNIEKHGKAGEVTLTARNKDDKTLLVCVTDDGIGLLCEDPNARLSQSGLGIRGMYQRAAILGASLSFVPGAGSGLTVRLEAPLPSDEEKTF